MQTVLMSSEEEVGETAGHAVVTSVRLTTTLYDVITALQEVVGADNDALVVGTVLRLLRSGRVTWRGQAREPLDSPWREAR